MTDRERNRFDALKRVKKFKGDHAADFPAAGSPAKVWRRNGIVSRWERRCVNGDASPVASGATLDDIRA